MTLLGERLFIHGVQYGIAQGGQRREIESNFASRQHKGVDIVLDIAKKARPWLVRIQIWRKMAWSFRRNSISRKIEPVSGAIRYFFDLLHPRREQPVKIIYSTFTLFLFSLAIHLSIAKMIGSRSVTYIIIEPDLKKMNILAKIILYNLKKNPTSWIDEFRQRKMELVESFYLTVTDKDKVGKQ